MLASYHPSQALFLFSALIASLSVPMLVVDLLGDLYATTWWVPMADAGLQQWPGGWAVESRADAYGPGPPLGTYRLRVPASRVGYVPEAQGGLPPGPRVLYVLGTRTSHGRTVRTAHRGTPGGAALAALRGARARARGRRRESGDARRHAVLTVLFLTTTLYSTRPRVIYHRSPTVANSMTERCPAASATWA